MAKISFIVLLVEFRIFSIYYVRRRRATFRVFVVLGGFSRVFFSLEYTMLELSKANTLLPSDLSSFLSDVRETNRVLEC